VHATARASEYVPASHVVQLVAAAAAEIAPALQSVHAVAPAAEYVPAPHVEKAELATAEAQK